MLQSRILWCTPSGGALALYLASIQGFTIEDTFCSDLEVRRVRIDDYGRLPA